jgi:hypothetical protein
MSTIYELLQTPKSTDQFFDQSTRTKNLTTLTKANLLTSNDSLISLSNQQSSQLYLNLVEGNYNGLIITADNTQILGLGNVVFNPTVDNLTDGTDTESLRISNNCRISNVKCLGDVSVNLGNTAIFNNCVFNGEIAIATTANAHFIGCIFASTGTCIDLTAGGAAFVIGCSRPNGGAHVGAPTIIAETT